jgi:NADH-quinone oxidoreductase subunit N
MKYLAYLLYLESFVSIVILGILFYFLIKKNSVRFYSLLLVCLLSIGIFLTVYYQDCLLAQNMKDIVYNIYLLKILLLNDGIETHKSLILYKNLINLIQYIQWEIKTDLVYVYPINIKFYNKSLIFNVFLFYSKIFLVFVFFICLLLSYYHFKIIKVSFDKLVMLLVPILLSNLILLGACDLIIVYLAIELQNLCLIFLIALKKKDSYNVQLSIRFFILNSIGSLFILLGIVLIYSIFLTSNMVNIYIIMSSLPLNIINSINLEFLFALTLLLIGLFFKLAVGPFGLWLVEIYTYGLTSSVLIYSLLPKIGYFIFLFHLYLSTSYYLVYWDGILKIIGCISILIGTFGALNQIYLKRLLAFSSLNYFGYILLSFIGFNQKSLIICILYFIIYIFISMYIWYIVIYLEKILKRQIIITDLVVLREKSEILAYLLSFSFFFLSGLPPFYLFVLKFMTFAIFLYTNTNILIILFFLICSYVSIFYYLKLIKIIHFNPVEMSDNIEHAEMYIPSIIFYLIGFYFICILSPFFFLLSENLIFNLDVLLNSYLKDLISVNVFGRVLYYSKVVFERKYFLKEYIKTKNPSKFLWALPNEIYFKTKNLYLRMFYTNIHFYDKEKLSLKKLAKLKKRSYFNLFSKTSMDNFNVSFTSYQTKAYKHQDKKFRIFGHTFDKKYYNVFTNYLIKNDIIGFRTRRVLFISEFPMSRFKKWILDYKKVRKQVYRLARKRFLDSLYDISRSCRKALAPLGIDFPLLPITKDNPFYLFNLYKYFILPTKRDNILFNLKFKKKPFKHIDLYFNKYLKFIDKYIKPKV